MSLEFYRWSEPTARKEYRCELCGDKIAKGEKHIRECGKYDGDLFDIRNHVLCREFVKTYLNDVGGTEWDSDSVQEWIRDKVCYDCEHGWYGDDTCEEDEFCCKKVLEILVVKEGE